MRAAFKILLCCLLFTRISWAGEQTTDECMAPDFKHQVVMLQGAEDTGGYELVIWEPSEKKPLFSRPAGSYAAFSAATQPANFKCLWSPDSKLVAIFERGTKRSGDTAIYFVNGDKVQEVSIPKLTSLIKPHLTAEWRAGWVRPEVWLPEHGLILSAVGTQMDEEHGNYRFILTLQLHTDKAGKFVAKIASFRQDRSVPFSIK